MHSLAYARDLCLLKPVQYYFCQLLLHGALHKRIKLYIARSTIVVKLAQEGERCLDQRAQILHIPGRYRWKVFSQITLKLLADDGIHERVFVGEVGIKSGSVNRGSLSDVLNTDCCKVFFGNQFHESV